MKKYKGYIPGKLERMNTNKIKDVTVGDSNPISRQFFESLGRRGYNYPALTLSERLSILADIVKPLNILLEEEKAEKAEKAIERKKLPAKKLTEEEKELRRRKREEKKTFHSFRLSYDEALEKYLMDEDFASLVSHPSVMKYIKVTCYRMVKAQRVRSLEIEDLAQDAFIHIVTDESIKERWQEYVESGEPCFLGYFLRFAIMDSVRKSSRTFSQPDCISVEKVLEKGAEYLLPAVMPESENTVHGLTTAEVKKELKKYLNEKEREYLNRYFLGKHIPGYFFAPIKKYNYRNSKNFTVLPSIAETAKKVWNNKFGYVFYIN